MQSAGTMERPLPEPWWPVERPKDAGRESEGLGRHRTEAVGMAAASAPHSGRYPTPGEGNLGAYCPTRARARHGERITPVTAYRGEPVAAESVSSL